jgi:hypothetical protein
VSFDYLLYGVNLRSYSAKKGKFVAMKKSKVFLGLAVLFMILIGVTSYDISRKTTFPGSKPQLKERLKKQFSQPDTLARPLKK